MNLSNIINEPKFGNTRLGRRARFWYYRLFGIAISLYEYENLPDSVNRDYLEAVLHAQGSIGWVKDKSGKLRALYGAYIGVDPYNFPVAYETANPVLGNLKGSIGVNAVWMRNNKLAMPTMETIREYAWDFANLDVSLRVNLDNLKTAKIYNAENSAQAKQINELYEKVISGQPAVVTNNEDFFSTDNGLKVFAEGVQSHITEFLEAKRTLLGEFLNIFGVNSTAYEKRERLLQSEVDSNNQELEINKNFFLSTRKEAIDEINRLFGENIKVKLIEAEKIINEEVDVYDETQTG